MADRLPFEIDLSRLAAQAVETPAMRESRARWERGHEAGVAGLPCPPDGDELAHRRAGLQRRARAGEIIMALCQGCRCRNCGEQNWGWRLGCRCWTAEDMKGEGPGMDYGLLVEPESDDPAAPARLMTRDELLAARAAGTPILDDMTGEPVPLEE